MIDNAIEVDFGAAGLGGSPTTTAGDGYYKISVDGFDQGMYFDRLLGDVNGDGSVDANDQALVTANLGVNFVGAMVDVDGTGKVTTAAGLIEIRNKGHKVGAGLHLDA